MNWCSSSRLYSDTIKIPLDYFPINTLLPSVRTLRLPHPVFITPPANAGGHWAVKSETQNRPQRVKVMLDTNTGPF